MCFHYCTLDSTLKVKRRRIVSSSDETATYGRHTGVTVLLNPLLCVEIVEIQDGRLRKLVVHCVIPESYRIPAEHIRAWRISPPELVFTHSVVWRINPESPAEHRFYFSNMTFWRNGEEKKYLNLAYHDVNKILNDAGDVLWKKFRAAAQKSYFHE